MLARDGPGDDDEDELASIEPTCEESEESECRSNDGPESEPPPPPPPPRSLLRLPLPQRIHHTTHMSFASSCL